jgi:hypothetical protein
VERPYPISRELLASPEREQLEFESLVRRVIEVEEFVNDAAVHNTYSCPPDGAEGTRNVSTLGAGLRS